MMSDSHHEPIARIRYIQSTSLYSRKYSNGQRFPVYHDQTVIHTDCDESLKIASVDLRPHCLMG